MSPRLVFSFLAFLLGSSAAVAAEDWSGPYLGLFAGYTEANDTWDDAIAPGAPAISPEGIMLGGFAGYAQGVKPLILGLEADLSFPDFSDEGDCTASTFDCSLDVQILSSLGGRVGLAVGALQVYGTAGVALGFVQAEASNGVSDSIALAGWTIGSGVEWQTEGGLRLGVEYRHTDYGEDGVTFAGVAQGKVDLETDDVRLRVSIPLN
jgi:outer membrane immunogenic protein